MTIDKNQIGKSRSDRFQYTTRYRWQHLKTRNMPDCGMAAVDQRCRTWTEADLIPKIFRSFSKVLSYQFSDIPTSAAEQPNNVSCSVGPRTMDFPIPIPLCQTVTDRLQLVATGFSRESDELLKYLHLAQLGQE
jgi:hypothetical protein